MSPAVRARALLSGAAACPGVVGAGIGHSRSLSEEAEAQGGPGQALGSWPRGQCRTLLCPTSALALSPLQSPVTCVLPKAWVAGFAFIPLRGDVTLSFHRWRLARHGQARPWGGGAPGRRPGGKEVASTCSGGVPCGQVQWGPGATPAGPTRPGTGVGKSTFPI